MRLTKRDRYNHFYTNNANCRNIYSLDGKKLEGEFFENNTLAIDGKAIDKLGQLEDIEDELGISLETYVRLHQDGFYGICEDDDHEKPYIYQFDNRCFNIFADDKTIVVYFEGSNEEYRTYRIKDYGKTWALTKEELL